MASLPPRDSDPLPECLPGSDIPQADNLQRVRLVVDAVAAGHTTQDAILADTHVSLRHVSYALHAARVLGLLEHEGRTFRLTPSGRELCATRRQSDDERRILREACSQSSIVSLLAPDLFGHPGPSVDAIAATIEERARLSPATARRRARTLLSWRLQVLEPTKYVYLLAALEGERDP
ncbi:MAG: hypothetical protein EOO75_17840 [Myxococcales bacterium]|nr:MAG: hypothetical protein EOO75_17840 [Myxococcales bacterium]